MPTTNIPFSLTPKMLEQQAAFYQELATGELSIPQAVRKMRQCTGLTIPEYAKWTGVSPRYLGDIERGLMNPTISLLEKIGAPFNLKVSLSLKGPNV